MIDENLVPDDILDRSSNVQPAALQAELRIIRKSTRDHKQVAGAPLWFGGPDR